MSEFDEHDRRSRLQALWERFRQGTVTRREFLQASAMLGAGTGLSLTHASRSAVAGPTVQPGSVKPRTGGTLGVVAEVKAIKDPAGLTYPSQGNIVGQVIENLTRIGPGGALRPWLLRSLQPSSDATRWTLRLRKGIRWSNGDAFTADDVIANIRRWFEIEESVANARLLAPLGEKTGSSERLRRGAVRRLDDYTVELNCSEPFVALPERLAHYNMKIVHRSYRTGQSFVRNPIGTGPFRLIRYDTGNRALLQARKDYWAIGPFVDRLEFFEIRNKATRLTAIQSGEAHLILDFDLESVAQARRSGVQVVEMPTGNTMVARMRSDKSPFSDHRVRKALQLAVDRDAVRRQMFGEYGLVGQDHHVSPIQPDYGDIPPVPYDRTEAKRLLRQAGRGGGTKLTIAVNSSLKTDVALAEALKSQFRAVNVRLTVNRIPSSQFWPKFTEWPFSITAWNQRPLGLDILNLAYRSDAAWNETGFGSRRFDALLDEAGRTPDIRDRRAIMGKAQKLLQDEAVILQSVWKPLFAVTNKRLQGYQLSPSGDFFAQDLWLT